MYFPTLEEVKLLSNKGNLIPIYREVDADLETPVSAYIKVSRPPYSFLFESVEGGEHLARYSFIGTEPESVIATGPGQINGETDPLTLLENILSKYSLVDTGDLPRFCGGAVGYLSYETIKYFEDVGTAPNDVLELPEAILMLTKTFIVFDHVRHKIRIVSHAHINGPNIEESYNRAIVEINKITSRLNSPLDPSDIPRKSGYESTKTISNMDKSFHENMVDKCKQYVVDGDVIQTVVSQRFSKQTSAHPFHIYRSLRTINPSPYMYYLDLDGFQIVGASPEMLVQLDKKNITMHPIAGTRPRSDDVLEDKRLEIELLNDEKEKAEHTMLLDLGRNDVGRVSEPGSVNVTEIMGVERYSHVMHIVSTVKGDLENNLSCFDVFRACFPAGTVSGAPKIRAMQIISELEKDQRGPYAGSVGYFDFAGNMDTAIAIRTMVYKDGVAHAQSGGGIVYDSNAQSEYDETIHKANAIMSAIESAEKTLDL
jgi:anthranilate synthase component 1